LVAKLGKFFYYARVLGGFFLFYQENHKNQRNQRNYGSGKGGGGEEGLGGWVAAGETPAVMKVGPFRPSDTGLKGQTFITAWSSTCGDSRRASTQTCGHTRATSGPQARNLGSPTFVRRGSETAENRSGGAPTTFCQIKDVGASPLAATRGLLPDVKTSGYPEGGPSALPSICLPRNHENHMNQINHSSDKKCEACRKGARCGARRTAVRLYGGYPPSSDLLIPPPPFFSFFPSFLQINAPSLPNIKMFYVYLLHNPNIDMGNIRSFSDFVAMYIDGFQHLTWGKPLWVLIGIKLFVLFAILRVFFFPNLLNTRFDTEEEKSNFVFKELQEKQYSNKNTETNESNGFSFN
jgi:hypothetical protein